MLAALTTASECNVLAFAGEGDAAAYQVGALKGLIESLGTDATQYDLVQGISAGAINAAVLGMYPVGQESDFVGNMTDFWTSFDKS
jgi:predicted acylesterase/phospholipase RssA